VSSYLPIAEHGLIGDLHWRDSRLALIFYVREQNLTSIIEKAHAQMQERAEFVFSETPGPEGEFRCRVRWPDDPEREAVLTVPFFQIGRSNRHVGPRNSAQRRLLLRTRSGGRGG
jgi:hypothetical protein